MKTWNKILITLALVQVLSMVFFTEKANGQDTLNCALKLQNAQALYESGMVDQIPDLLEGCLLDGFTKEEALTAYKLVIMTYLFNDMTEKADSAMLGFLKQNPEYEISPTDHSSFIYLYNKFIVKPVIQISVHLGTNLPYVTFVKHDPLPGLLGKVNYSSKATNLFVSLETKFKIKKDFELSIAPGFSQLAFTRTEEIHGFDKLQAFEINTYTEKSQRLEIPVTVTYDFKSFGKFSLYGRLGAGAGLNLKNSALAETKPLDLNNTDVFTGPEVSRKDSRIFLDAFIQTGVGIKYKISHGFINLEVLTDIGLMNQTIKGGSSAWDLATLYHYNDDDFNINALNFNIGYSYIFYKPLKRQ